MMPKYGVDTTEDEQGTKQASASRQCPACNRPATREGSANSALWRCPVHGTAPFERVPAQGR